MFNWPVSLSLVAAEIAFIVGIGLTAYIDWLWKIDCLVLVLLAVVLLVVSFKLKNALVALIVWCGVFVLLGALRFIVALPVAGADKIWSYNGAMVEMEAWADAEPVRASQQKIKVQVLSVAGQEVSGRVLVVAPLYPKFNYGERLKIKCALQTPGIINGFRYDWFLAKDDVYSLCYRPSILLLSADQGQVWLTNLLRLRQYLALKMEAGMVEPAAGLAKAMTLGYQTAMDAREADFFTQAGTNHVISISGLHISVLVLILLQLLLLVGFNRRVVFVLALPLLLLYVVMVGSPAAALRSAVMALVVLAAVSSGRLATSGRVWLLAAAILLAINPWWLVADIGFQLSFLSVGGLIYLTPLLFKVFGCQLELQGEKIGWWQKAWQWLQVALLASLAATLVTAPAVWWYFGRVSLIAPLANLLIVPLSSAALLAILAAWPLCLILPPMLAFGPAQLLNQGLISLNRFWAAIPWSSIVLPSCPLWFLFLFYVSLIIWVIVDKNTKTLYK